MSTRMDNPELKPLKDAEREFIRGMVYEGLNRVEAYCLAYGESLNETNRKRLTEKSLKTFYKPNVNRYYHALMEEIREAEVEKGVWTKEVATQKLVRLIEQAEREIYDEGKQLTMSRMNAILLPVKELNTMNGFNTTTNVNVEGCVVQIVGEDKLED